MKRLGIIARADVGGLSQQTCAYVKHLKPDTVLIVDLGKRGRGKFNPRRVEIPDGAQRAVATGPEMPLEAITWMLRNSDVVFTAETFYHPEFVKAARACGVKTVLHANPELHVPERNADVILNPTPYMLDRYPTVLPMPCPDDHVTPRRRDGAAKVFLHIAAPASNDRNGTELVKGAARLVKTPGVTFRILGHAGARWAGSTVQVEEVPHVEEWWEAYADDVDVLLSPRRYAGLNLPMQEAAAFGIPTITLNTPPYSEGYGVTHRIDWSQEQNIRMAGGEVKIYNSTPILLARAVDHFAGSDVSTEGASKHALGWAKQNSWEKLLPEYRKVLS